LSLTALAAGIVIYGLFRNLDILLFTLFPVSVPARPFPIPAAANNPVIKFIIYNLPDGLWCLSGILCIRAIWLFKQKWLHIYLGIFLSVAVILEISQISPLVPGTFDPLDLGTIGITALVEGIIHKKLMRRKER
jgi:hypothetical protein